MHILQLYNAYTMNELTAHRAPPDHTLYNAYIMPEQEIRTGGHSGVQVV